jgi:hypothetical protein
MLMKTFLNNHRSAKLFLAVSAAACSMAAHSAQDADIVDLRSEVSAVTLVNLDAEMASVDAALAQTQERLAKASKDMAGQFQVLFANAGSTASDVPMFSFGSKAVTGKPYSADIVSDSVRKLGDGNTITNSSRQRVYRNSAGQTRTETFAADGSMRYAHIDLGNGERVTLVPKTKTAYKSTSRMGSLQTMFSNSGGQGKSGTSVKCVRKVTVNGQTTTTSDTGDNCGNVSVNMSGDKRTVKIVRNGETQEFELPTSGTAAFTASDGKQIRIMTPKIGFNVSGSSEVMKQLDGLRQSAELSALGELNEFGFGNGMVEVFTSTGGQPAQSKSLGTRTMEGVAVEGSGTERITPAGKIGNSQPIIDLTERWYSPDLEVVVMRKSDSPLRGTSTYKLSNINRAEPSADLFKVPSDYTSKDSKW